MVVESTFAAQRHVKRPRVLVFEFTVRSMTFYDIVAAGALAGEAVRRETSQMGLYLTGFSIYPKFSLYSTIGLGRRVLHTLTREGKTKYRKVLISGSMAAEHFSIQT